MQFKIEGLEAIEGPDHRVTVHKLADGSRLPIATPPTRDGTIPEETHAAAAPVRQAANAFAALEKARRDVAKDLTLSDFGREQKVKGAREAAQRSIGEAETQLAQLEATTVGLRDQAFAPPKLESADLANALIDQEVRTYVRGLSPAERTEYLSTLKANPRHLEALLRSPVPIPVISEHANRLWAEKHQNSAAAVKAQGYAAAIEWARGTLRSIRSKV